MSFTLGTLSSTTVSGCGSAPDLLHQVHCFLKAGAMAISFHACHSIHYRAARQLFDVQGREGFAEIVHPAPETPVILQVPSQVGIVAASGSAIICTFLASRVSPIASLSDFRWSARIWLQVLLHQLLHVIQSHQGFEVGGRGLVYEAEFRGVKTTHT